MKHTRFFNKFLSDEVNLNQTRLDRLNASVEAVSDYLSRNLASYRKVERQGSYALRTIIKPVKENQEYDADILLYVKFDSDVEPKEYIGKLYKCLKENKVYEEKVHRRTRCVVVDYAGDFHLDIIPCITIDDNHYICNNKINEFEETDGTGYRDWFNDKNRITHGHLKRVTRLLKYLRDHKGNFTAKSILLTTLIGNAVCDEGEADYFESLPDALKNVSTRINQFLQENDTMPRISNPVLPHEDFTRHWNQTKYENFRDLFNVYNEKINQAFDATDHNDSVDKWRAIFGENFGEKKGTDGTSGARQDIVPSVVAVTPVKPWAK